jgi:hypothetical protein
LRHTHAKKAVFAEVEQAAPYAYIKYAKKMKKKYYLPLASQPPKS